MSILGISLGQTAQFYQPKVADGHHIVHHFVPGELLTSLCLPNHLIKLIYYLVTAIGHGFVDVDGAAGYEGGLPAAWSNHPQVPNGGLFLLAQPSLQCAAHCRLHRLRCQDAKDSWKFQRIQIHRFHHVRFFKFTICFNPSNWWFLDVFTFDSIRYTTCIIWLAFLPIYFGTANTNEVT